MLTVWHPADGLAAEQRTVQGLSVRPDEGGKGTVDETPGGGVNPPVHIDSVRKAPTSPEDVNAQIELEKVRHLHHQQNGFLIVLGIVVLSFFVPLGVWLTRLAMGM